MNLTFNLIMKLYPVLTRAILHDIKHNFYCPNCNAIEWSGRSEKLTCKNCGYQKLITLDEYLEETNNAEIAKEILEKNTYCKKNYLYVSNELNYNIHVDIPANINTPDKVNIPIKINQRLLSQIKNIITQFQIKNKEIDIYKYLQISEEEMAKFLTFDEYDNQKNLKLMIYCLLIVTICFDIEYKDYETTTFFLNKEND